MYALYWLMRGQFRLQNAMLLVASYVFYAWWDIRFTYLIVLSTVVDYCAGLMIDRGCLSRSQRASISGFLVLAAFLFVLPNYGALHFARSGVHLTLDVDWPAFWSKVTGWWVLVGTVVAVLAANLTYALAAGWAEPTRRKFVLTCSVLVNLGLLGFFKYFNFFAESLIQVSQTLFGATPSPWTLNVVLPVGISFYTFQTMSYTIDVYRRQMHASDRLSEFAAYVAFFPQLVAGPIERGKHLLPQFCRPRPPLTRDAWNEGIWLITWGLFKKIVVADNMAIIVNQAFNPYDTLSSTAVPTDGLRILVAVYAFAFQIYGDFSGYTDIARGTAKLLGFNIMLNFSLPYFATSPSAFWQRWHISLSTWLRDYLYFPLGGSRGTATKTYRNLSLTMLLGGLWHGAAWTFVVWGAYHGLLLILYRALGLRTEKRPYAWWVSALMGLVMFHLTCLGWLVFRSQNLTTVGIFCHSIVLHPFGSTEAWSSLCHLAYYAWFLLAFQVVQSLTHTLSPMANFHWFLRLNVWVYIVMSLLVFSRQAGQEFIYFAF